MSGKPGCFWGIRGIQERLIRISEIFSKTHFLAREISKTSNLTRMGRKDRGFGGFFVFLDPKTSGVYF